jgi:hypothetical protein
MATWMQLVITLCVVAVTATLVPVLVSVRRSVLRVEALLAATDRDLLPLAAEIRGLVAELRARSEQAGRELEQIGRAARRLGDVSERLGTLMRLLGGMSRAGRLVGAAAGMGKGLSLILRRRRR